MKKQTSSTPRPASRTSLASPTPRLVRHGQPQLPAAPRSVTPSNPSQPSFRTGFTVLELVIVGVFATLLFVFFFLQKQNVDAMNRDAARKTAINAMYYALEESFHKDNGYYPETISEENIKVIDPALWTDPNGINLGDPASSYSYEPANCEEGKCQEYTLKAKLEKEDAYIKYNRN